MNEALRAEGGGTRGRAVEVDEGESNKEEGTVGKGRAGKWRQGVAQGREEAGAAEPIEAGQDRHCKHLSPMWDCRGQGDMLGGP